MEEAKDLNTVIKIMEEAQEKARNLITTIRAKERYAISKDPQPPPTPPGGKSQTELAKLNIINNTVDLSYNLYAQPILLSHSNQIYNVLLL